MASMPRCADPVTDLPLLLRVRDRDDLADRLVAGDDGEAVSEPAVLDRRVRVADTAGECFGDDLSNGLSLARVLLSVLGGGFVPGLKNLLRRVLVLQETAARS